MQSKGTRRSLTRFLMNSESESARYYRNFVHQNAINVIYEAGGGESQIRITCVYGCARHAVPGSLLPSFHFRSRYI